MKIIVKSLSDKDFEDIIEIFVDDKLSFRYEGNVPIEGDTNYNFINALKIPKLMIAAFNAGRRGDEFEVEFPDLA